MTQEKKGKITEAMAAIMAEIGAIGKDRTAKMKAGDSEFSYAFRGIDDVYNALHPIMTKHKVFVLPEVMEVRREERTTSRGGKLGFVTVQMNYHFTHADGSRETILMVGEGMDAGDKATAKALSGALKYALFQAFMIPTDEAKDSEHDTYQIADEEAAAAIPGGIPDANGTEADAGREEELRAIGMNIWTDKGMRKYTISQINTKINKARIQGEYDGLQKVLEELRDETKDFKPESTEPEQAELGGE